MRTRDDFLTSVTRRHSSASESLQRFDSITVFVRLCRESPPVAITGALLAERPWSRSFTPRRVPTTAAANFSCPDIRLLVDCGRLQAVRRSAKLRNTLNGSRYQSMRA